MPPRSLADDLRGRSDDALALLLASRPDLLHPVPPDMTALAARAGSATSTARALDRLDALSLSVARAVVDAGEPCTGHDALAAFPQDSRDEAEKALGGLRVLALVWGDDDALRLVRTARESIASTHASDIVWPPPVVDVTMREPARVDLTAGQHALATVMGVTALAEAWSGDDAPAVLRKGGLAVRDLTLTARLLHVTETTAALWIETAQAAGLLARDAETDERWRPTHAYDDWHDSPLASQWVTLARAWWKCMRAPSLIVDGANALSDDVQQRGMPALREQVIAVLAGLSPGEAPNNAADIARAVDSVAPRQAGTARDHLIQAIVDELEILGFTGGGALASMGRAAADVNDVTAHSLAEIAMPTPLDHVLIQADLTAVAPGPLLPDVARELRSMADVESTGGAVVYRFTPDSIRRALDRGRDASTLLDFLRGISRTPVPQPLEYLIEDADRRHGTVRVGVANAYIRCDDETALTGLLADPRAQTLGCIRVSPTVITVNGRVEDAIELLREHGLHPVAETADGQVAIARPRRARAPQVTTTAPVVRRDAAPTLITAAIATLRASAPVGSVTTTIGLKPMPAADTMSVLRRAIADSVPVWLAHGEEDVLVDPIRLAGGTLTAVDRVTGEARSFAVARLGAAEIADATT